MINDLGQVTGTSETASGAVGVFLYSGGTMQDVNNIVYIPLNSFQYRFWDRSAGMR